MDYRILMANQKQRLLRILLDTNRNTAQFGLSLSEADCEILLEERTNILKTVQRVEFGQSVLPELIRAFCASPYINQQNYLATLLRLQEIFFRYKNEMQDELSDDELLQFMRTQFDTTCFGDLDYLESTCLAIFAEAVRAGYTGHITSSYEAFQALDITTRWDRNLYQQALEELTGWR